MGSDSSARVGRRVWVSPDLDPLGGCCQDPPSCRGKRPPDRVVDLPGQHTSLCVHGAGLKAIPEDAYVSTSTAVPMQIVDL
mmetsp:Transcript_13224/g.20944  ORF Transcript_13224/g.20944 Transcript_13224/m.20944 type:complete len:81 (-) Transcript_13224:101-343(-)